MPEFYMTIAQKYFPTFCFGGREARALLRLCSLMCVVCDMWCYCYWYVPRYRRLEDRRIQFITVRRYALHGLCDPNSVRLSVCPSFRHTRGLCPHGLTYGRAFFTAW